MIHCLLPFSVLLFAVAAHAGDRDRDRVPDDIDRCRTVAEDRDHFQDNDGCPDPDNDGDGVCDPVITETGRLSEFVAVCTGKDACQDIPEDRDGFEDENGCPDPDNDGDGVRDHFDKCPMVVEDMDGFEDGDGCPDPDNDRDGVADSDDRCALHAEDRDGFEDGDGCPDLDNDRDGIPDDRDHCPLEPETANGVEDDDGCADNAEQPIPDAAELTIDFVTATADLTFESRVLLDDIVRRLRAWPRVIAGFRVWEARKGGAVTPAEDSTLLVRTQAQAQAIADYLIANGIHRQRLRIRGEGAWIGADAAERARIRPGAHKVLMVRVGTLQQPLAAEDPGLSVSPVVPDVPAPTKTAP